MRIVVALMGWSLSLTLVGCADPVALKDAGAKPSAPVETVTKADPAVEPARPSSVAAVSDPFLADPATASPHATNGNAEPVAKSGDAPAAATQATLKLLNWDETLKLVESHKGKVVVLDVWNASCVPCVREFPHLVALQKSFGAKVACIGVNTDYIGIKTKPPESLAPEVGQFLLKQQATFDNVLCTLADEELYEKLELAGPPAVLVYDRAGKLRKRFDNEKEEFGKDGFTYEKHVTPFVAALLEEAN